MNYNAVALKAKKKILQYGSKCVIRRVSDEVYNTSTNKYEKNETLITGYALAENYDLKNINGTSIKSEDVMLTAVFDGVPVTGEIVEFSGKKYSIVSIRPLNPDGKCVIYYEVQCR